MNLIPSALRAIAITAVRGCRPRPRHTPYRWAPFRVASEPMRALFRYRITLSRAASRGLAAVASLTALTLGLTAIPATPALASPAITYPGGDIVLTINDGNIPQATMQNIINNTWPQAYGAPVVGGAGYNQATWVNTILNNEYKGVGSKVSIDPPIPAPPDMTGTTVTVSGNTVTADIPASTASTNSKDTPAWIATAYAALTSGLAGVVSLAFCVGFFARTGATPGAPSALAASFCAGASAFISTVIFYVVYYSILEIPITPDKWASILAAAVVFAALAATGGIVTAWVLRNFSGVWRDIAQGVLDMIHNSSIIFGADTDRIGITAGGYFGAIGAAVPNGVLDMAPENGWATPVTSADAIRSTAFSGKCVTDNGGQMDDLDAVTLDACAVSGTPNAAQDWTVWSNHMVEMGARCLWPTNNGTGNNTKVTLLACDDRASEQWQQKGNAIVNTVSGRCLDDPAGANQNGVQLQLYDCNGSPAQQWKLPGNSPPVNGGPCDIYAYYGTPCAAAYSTTRALYAGYSGRLYRIQRASDGTSVDVPTATAGGYVNAGVQDGFCAGTNCTITEVYDQSPNGNNLPIEGPGGAGGQDRGADANALPVTISGHEAYGIDVERGVGYRLNSTRGIAVNGQPEGMYMVASGTHVNTDCCFDFGNVESNSQDNGASHMDAVNLTTWCGGNSQPCNGSGPWVEADLENGQWMGSGPNPGNSGNKTNYVTAMLKNNGQTDFALQGGDSTNGGLTKWYDGPLPPGYAPMHQEGGIVLGTGGDNSNNGVGSFFEGVMTSGYPSDTADAAVQANIVAAGYAGNTNPSNGGSGGGGGGGSAESGDVVATSASGQAVVHSTGATGAGAAGFSSVYTVNSSNGHLQETYLPYMFDSWYTQDLSAEFGTPPVMAGTQPVSFVHCGFTSVYTIDAGSGDLQETYLPAIGDGWNTQDLSANYGTPPSHVTPTVVMHNAGGGSSYGCGWTSVYTVDGNGDLQETYLPNEGFPGDPWHTQDLSVNYRTPHVMAGTSPVSIVHCGWTSVYTVDAGSGHLQETYLPAIGDPWTTQDLSNNYGTPPTNVTPTTVMHDGGAPGGTSSCGWTSVYTIDTGSNHLQETYLPNAGFPGDAWTTQDLSAKYGTPPVAGGTQPVALVHMGYTSVYTIDAGSGQLQESYVPAIGDPWSTQSLSANYGTPTTSQSPIVLLHPDAAGNIDWTSVFTIDNGSSHLQETYLPNVGFPGDPWHTQDLSANYGTPPAT